MPKIRNFSAVIPVKSFSQAKQRLSGALTSELRHQLAIAMFTDTLEACMSAHFGSVLVVTSDPHAATIAKDRGAYVVPENAKSNMNEAVQLGLSESALRGSTGAVVVPCDIPQITSDLLIQIVETLQISNAVTLVEATQDGGTNLLAMSPPTLITPSFGQGSFRRHLQEAHNAAVTPTILVGHPGSTDLDRPGDLSEFMTMETNGATRRLLSLILVHEDEAI